MKNQFSLYLLVNRTAYFAITVLTLLIISVYLTYAQRGQKNATGVRHSFQHQGKERAYRIHVPSSYEGKSPVPLLFCFHGGGGNAEIGSAMGFTPLSEKEGFIVVYPEGLNKHWNDGRNSPKYSEQDAETDDSIPKGHSYFPERIIGKNAMIFLGLTLSGSF